MDDLRSWWEVPSIAHFCSLFRSAFDLTDFDIEDLEEGFLQSETEDGSAFLLDLLCRLLNGCYGRKDITITNYDLYVKDIIKYKWDVLEHPIKEKAEFKALSMREKVELIYAICEYRLDTEDVIEQLKGFEGDSMRVEPLGKDKNGALYWYFYGNRLYMEDPKPKKELTKEEKKAKDRERRIESKRKKLEEKRQRKEERIKLKALRKAEREKKIEEAKKAEESNTRRSGRLRTKKLVVPESESSESSSSSEEEEKLEDSSDEDTEVEEVEEKKTGRGKSRKTPAKTPTKKGATNQKTPKKETPVKQASRTSSRKSARQQKTTEPKTPQMVDTGVRRSARKRKQPEPPPLPSPYNSDTEEEQDYDIDSGHESAGSLKSEASKVSAKSNSSKKSAAPAKRSSRRPTVNLNLQRDLSLKEGDDEEIEDDKGSKDGLENESETKKDGNETEAGKSKEKGNDEMETDTSKEKDSKEMVGDECKGNGDKIEANDVENEMVEDDIPENKGDLVKECDKKVVETEKGQGEGKTNDADENDKDKKACEDVGSGDRKAEEEKMEVVKDSDDAKDGLEIKCEPEKATEDEIEVNNDLKDNNRVDDTDKIEEGADLEKIDDNSNEGDAEDIVKSEIKTEAESVKDDVTIKTEKVGDETDEKMETEEDNDKEFNEQNVAKTEASNSIKDEDIKPDYDLEDISNDSNDSRVKSSLRKRNIEHAKSEMKADNSGKDEDELDKKEEDKPDPFTLSKPAVEPTPSKSTTRWHLVCETLDDWVNLAEWFKESQVRCEKSLSKVIREDFLPVLPEIIEAREKEKQKKLLQEQELRRSNRLTYKMREKLEQEKILAEALAEEEKARIKAEDERKLKEEQLRLEDENRQREDRRKAREERAKRLSMRGERARLIAEGKEIPADMIYTRTHKYKDDGDDSDDSRCDLKEEEDYGALIKVISAMKYHKDCWPFLQPVTDEQAPGYSDVIKRPMDLSKIEEKVEKREYRSTQHFLSDFRLMFNNCKRFNGQDSEFSDCARSMETMLKKYMKRFVSEEPTDKYYEDKPFMVPGARGAGPRTGEKRYRPQRAASSRALQTVHKALNSDESEESSDEDDHVPQRKKAKDSTASPFRTQSHDKLLLDKMIELKRQREKKLAASALHNHGVITRGPERVRVQNPQGGVMIIPKSEMNASGVLRMAATREIKRKVNQQLPSLNPSHRNGNGSSNQTLVKANFSNSGSGLSVIDQTTPGSTQPKVIKIVASNASGQPSVKQTAENVRVSSDGFLIINGKNSGVKVSENTKIVIQPPAVAPGSAPLQPSLEREAQSPSPNIVKQTTTPSEGPSSTTITQNEIVTGSPSSTFPNVRQVPVQGTSVSSSSKLQIQQQLSLQGLLRQTANNPSQFNQHQALQGLVNQIGGQGNLTPEVKKKLAIAQRILLQHHQKKKLLEQQKAAQSAKLDSNAGPSSSSAIEDRLRDPSVNLDKQLGSVSQNVISNVNIASDILDTYYSVLNDAKSKTSNRNSPSVSSPMPKNTQQLNQNQAVPQSGANIVSSETDSSVQGVTNLSTPTGQLITSGQTTLSEQINQNQALPQRGDEVVSSSSVSSVQVVTGQTTPVSQTALSAALQNVQFQKSTPAQQGNMSQVTRQLYDLISKTGAGGLATVLANAQKMKLNLSAAQTGSGVIGCTQNQLPVVSSQCNTVPESVIQTPQSINQIPQTINSEQLHMNQVKQIENQVPQNINQTQIINQAQPVVNHIPQSVNQAPQTSSNRVPQVVNQTQPVVNQVLQSGNQIPQAMSNITGSSSISELLQSAMLKPMTQTIPQVSPIEALLVKSTPNKTVPDSVPNPIPKSPILNALTSRTPVSSDSFTNPFETSPEKSERQNLFDSFEGNEVSTTSMTSNSGANEPSLTNKMEVQEITREDMSKEVKLKLKADRISLPSSSTLNFGSPVKATSVLEALKCKLHTVKPQVEGCTKKSSEGSISADTNVENVDEYLAPASNETPSQEDQTLIATSLESAMNTNIVSGLASNVPSQILNIGLNPNMGVTSNAIPTGYQQAVSVVSSVPTSGNLSQSSIQTALDGLSQGNVNFSSNMLQGHVIKELLPTTVQVSATNLMQGSNVSPMQYQTISEPGAGNLPNVQILQEGTRPQAPVQVSNAVLQALIQSSSVTINPSTQNALLQQLSTIINNRSTAIHLGTNNVVATDLKPVNPLNTLPQGIQTVQQVMQSIPQVIQSTPQVIQSAPQIIQSVPQVIQSVQQVMTVPQLLQSLPQIIQSVPQVMQSVPQVVQSIPQGIQSVDLREASSAVQYQTVDSSDSLPTGFTEIANTRLVTEGDFSGLDTRTNLNMMTSNLSSVNQSGLQASSFMTETDVEMMDTSQNASLSLNVIEENQS